MGGFSYANTPDSPHVPISHCYHWLDEGGHRYLKHKYAHAKDNKGELTFYTTAATSNGSVAGPGLYCAKAPISSYSYGDRVIKVEFVDDVVLLDETTGKQYCGLDGNQLPQAECDKKAWDVKFYSGGGKGVKAWYVISNPQSVIRWSANSSELEKELIQNKAFTSTTVKTHFDKTIQAMVNERASQGEKTIENLQARLGLIELIQNHPEKLKAIPATYLIDRALELEVETKLDNKTVSHFFETQIERIVLDQKLSTKDLTDLFKQNETITSIAIELLNKKMAEEKKDINTSLYLLLVLEGHKELNLEVEYLQQSLENEVANSSQNLITILKQIHTVSSTKRSPHLTVLNDLIFRHETLLASTLLKLEARDLVLVAQFADADYFFSEETRQLKKKILKKIMKKLKKGKSRLSLNKQTFKLHLGTQASFLQACQIGLSYYHNDLSKVKIKTNKSTSEKTNPNQSSFKEITEVCKDLGKKLDTVSYDMTCSVSRYKKYSSEHYREDLISIESLAAGLSRCKKIAQKQFPDRHSFTLKKVKTKVSGLSKIYEARCEVDDDPDFTPDQVVIGNLKTDTIASMYSQCQKVAKATFPDRNSAGILDLKIAKPLDAQVQAKCHVDDDPDFTFDQIVLTTVYGKTIFEAEAACVDLRKALYPRNYSSGVRDFKFLVKQKFKGECHIDDDPDFTRDQEVQVLKAQDKMTIDQYCHHVAKTRYPGKYSYKVFYD